MPPLDLTTVLNNAPLGEWIALSHDQQRIVATAKVLEAAIEAARLRGENEPIVLKVPPVALVI